MGLKKSRTVAGFTAEYWNISDFAWSKERGTIVLILPNYKDKITREEGLEKKFVGSINTFVTPDEDVLHAFLSHLYDKARLANTQYDETVEGVDGEGNPTTEVTHFFSDALDE